MAVENAALESVARLFDYREAELSESVSLSRDDFEPIHPLGSVVRLFDAKDAVLAQERRKVK